MRATAWLRAGAAALALLPVLPAWAGVASLGERWQKPELTVCFFGGNAEQRHVVLGAMADWVVGTGLTLDTGGRTPRECGAGPTADVRIRLGNFTESWSFVGTNAQKVPPTEPTMALPLGASARPLRWSTLHEFGHVLSLLHPDQDPQSECRNEIDLDALRRLSGWSEAATNVNLRPVVPNNGQYLISPYDRRSVMRPLLDPEYFSRGERSPCWGPPIEQLSDDDRDLVRRLYPPRPQDVRAERHAAGVSIVLDGALAQETFQYVVMALHQNRLIGLRPHVDTRGDTLGQVLFSEKLSPTTAVSKDFEKFLCDINRHVCSRVHASVNWQNQRATINIGPIESDCNTHSLSRAVLCLPNVRVQSQLMLVQARFVPRDLPLPAYVVDRLKGCDTWDDDCRSLVQSLNEGLSKKYLDGDRSKSRTPLDLTLPARVYRIPLEIQGDEDRKRIETVVAEVRRARARALRVDAADIAVRLVSPVGNPRPQSYGRVLSEPATGYANALLAMNYPFTDAEREKELFGYYPVDVAIWDTRVDTKHCELAADGNSIVYSTEYAAQPPEASPPPAAPECGQPHDGSFAPVERFDHATFVAGIVAAQVNGKGIAGVNPLARLWSWDVVNGDQFNAGDDPFIEVHRRYRLQPAVVNISQTYPVNDNDQGSALETLLFGAGRQVAGAHQRRLFVAAAGYGSNAVGGREGKRIDTQRHCRAFPACWSNTDLDTPPRNLVSVVALDREGKGLLRDPATGAPATNHGQAFDVAAVGEATSTMHGNWIGAMRGTSFATPYVTGLASLIIGKAQKAQLNYSMAEVKQRVLATADRDTDALRESSYFGRIHFARALDFENDVVELKSDSTACTDCILRGRLDRTALPQIEVTYRPFADGASERKTLQIANVRRITADPDRPHWTVIYLERERLQRLDRVEPLNPGLQLQVNGRRFSFSNLKDFVACSFKVDCGGR